MFKMKINFQVVLFLTQISTLAMKVKLKTVVFVGTRCVAFISFVRRFKHRDFHKGPAEIQKKNPGILPTSVTSHLYSRHWEIGSKR